MKVAMLLLASGRGVRLGTDVPKAWVECAGEPLVVRSLRRLARLLPPGEREIVVAVHDDDRDRWLDPRRAALEALGADRFVSGGATRQESMRRAWAAASPDCGLALIHDAARPFFPLAATRVAIERARTVGAALLAVPVADTLKTVDASGRVLATLDRARTWAAQTPQVIRRDHLDTALRRAAEVGFDGTDDVSLCEHAGTPVVVVPGSRLNVKVTTREDLALAECLASLADAEEEERS